MDTKTFSCHLEVSTRKMASTSQKYTLMYKKFNKNSMRTAKLSPERAQCLFRSPMLLIKIAAPNTNVAFGKFFRFMVSKLKYILARIFLLTKITKPTVFT